MTDKYPFADELKSEFRDRGAAVSGMQATPTSELVHRAEMGEDPRVNVAEEAFRENYRARQNERRNEAAQQAAQSGPEREQVRRTNPRPAGDPRRERRAQAGRPAPNTQGRGSGQASRDNARGNAARQGRRPDPARDDGERDTVSEEITSRNHARYNPERERGNVKKIKVRRSFRSIFGNKEGAGSGEDGEIVVKRGSFPVLLLALCLIGVMVVFAIVQSVARVYQTSSNISGMNAELARLSEEERALNLKLEEKNDIRTIREIAAGELGMVDEDAMQRRFVTVSGGERIEILEEPAEQESPGWVLFSALGETLGRLFGRSR